MHPPLGTSLYRCQTYLHVPATSCNLLASKRHLTGKLSGRPREPRDISSVAYEIRSTGQYRTAQILGPLAMRDCRMRGTYSSALLRGPCPAATGS